MAKGLNPGLYFGITEEAYRADPAISRTDIVNLLDTPNTYWKHSHMNPDRVKKPASDPMKYGTAFDCLLFTPERFPDKYQIVPIDAWEQHKEKIEYEKYFQIIESIKVLRKGKDSNMFLSGGMPQVCVVFDDDGVRYKTLHDYFMIPASSDFKSSYDLNVYHLKKAFDQFGYDVQLRLYKRSRERVKEQIKAGEADIYGTVAPAFIDAFMTAALNEMIFIFQRVKPPHPFLPVMPEDDTEESGLRKILLAREIWEKNFKIYGTREWPVCEGKIKPFSMFYGFRED